MKRPVQLTMCEFENLVEETLEDLPTEFKELLQNLAVVVEEEPSEDDLEYADDDETELLGIFRGSARTERSWDEVPGLPEQIAIFRGPIARISSSRSEAAKEIRDTVIHELGHYFGLSDEELPY